jgi:hypothetical protein
MTVLMLWTQPPPQTAAVLIQNYTIINKDEDWMHRLVSNRQKRFITVFDAVQLANPCPERVDDLMERKLAGLRC